MKTRWSGLVLGFCLVIVVLLVLIGERQTAFSQECRIIRIDSEAASTGPSQVFLEPQKTWIDKGDCVVWFNRARDVGVRVIFKEGKACEAGTEGSTGFAMQPIGSDSCYVTDYLKLGKTASLRFTQVGSYMYRVEVERKGSTAEGEIIVRERKRAELPERD